MKLKPLTTLAVCIAALCLQTPSDAQQRKQSDDYAASERQRKEMSSAYGISEEQASFVQKFSYIRTRKIDSLSRLNLPAPEFRKQREKVTDEYYQSIFSILTAEQQKLFDAEAFKAARSGEVTALNLPPMKAVEMGRIKAAYVKDVKAVEDKKLQSREYKAAKTELDKKYRSDLKAFLGEKKFAEWVSYKDSENERRFKKTFGFTDEQYKKYIALENQQAIDILKIKNSGLSADERSRKIADAKKKKVTAMKEMLPEDVFNKWNEYYQRKENKIK